jgi:hypothetical protein
MVGMIPLFRPLLACLWDSPAGTLRGSAAGRPEYRQTHLELCEERTVLSANGTDFVTALYSDILNRAPDQAALHDYNSQLQGGAPPVSVVRSIWDSAEHRGIQIDGFYQTLLHRTADPEGRQFWINEMLSGVPEETVVVEFVTSVEYVQHNPLGETYVTALYHDILGRSPDSEGLTNWTDLADDGQVLVISEGFPPAHYLSDTVVARDFINSHEHHLKLVDSFYANFLQRSADSAGEADIVQALDQGQANDESVALAFMSSTEYVNHHPHTPQS